MYTSHKPTREKTTLCNPTPGKTTLGNTTRRQVPSKKYVDMSLEFEDGIWDARRDKYHNNNEYDSDEDDPHTSYVDDWYTRQMYEQLDNAHGALVNFWLNELTAIAGKGQRYRESKPWTELKELLTYDTIYSKSSHWDNLLDVIEWHDFVELMPSEKSRATLSSRSL